MDAALPLEARARVRPDPPPFPRAHPLAANPQHPTPPARGSSLNSARGTRPHRKTRPDSPAARPPGRDPRGGGGRWRPVREGGRHAARADPRTGRPLGPHGRNAYRRAARWFAGNSPLVDPGTRDALLGGLALERAPLTGSVVDDADLLALLELAPSAELELAFLVLRDTALRPHELLSVRLEDVRLQHGAL
ncbi:MAG: hypothetical protein ACTSU5_05930 [Promethearchaeota archaeon]